jgi:CelD/BcsL family acetyltransferase involved in cellulose biosynthesis
MSIWRQLEVDLQSRRLMCSSIWTETWLNHFGSLIPHQFAIAWRDGSPCGVCMLTRSLAQRNGPFQLRTWHVGTAGEPEGDSTCVEYNVLLVRPEDRADFQQAIWEWVSNRTDWDEFRLDGFGERELTGWPTSEKQWLLQSKSACYFDLTAAREHNVATLAMLGSQTRAVIRQNLKKCGTTVCQWAETVPEAEAIFAEQVELHQRRWNADGLPGCYASRVFHAFHLELLQRLVPLGLMGLFRVQTGHGTLGCAQVLIDDDRACLYQGGRVLSADPRLSIGVVVDFLLIEECRLRGLSAVDYLAGDSDHKRRLSTSSTPLVWAVCRRPSFKHRVVDGLRTVKQALGRYPSSSTWAALSQDGPQRSVKNLKS